MKYFILLLALWSGVAWGNSPRLLDTDSVYFESGKIWHLYDPYFDTLPLGEYWTYGIAAGFDLTFVEYKDFRWYWNNRVEGDTTNYQFRRVAWKYDFGFSYSKVDFFWNHRSEHLLDMEHKTFYPLSDRFGVRLYFYGR